MLTEASEILSRIDKCDLCQKPYWKLQLYPISYSLRFKKVCIKCVPLVDVLEELSNEFCKN